MRPSERLTRKAGERELVRAVLERSTKYLQGWRSTVRYSLTDRGNIYYRLTLADAKGQTYRYPWCYTPRVSQSPVAFIEQFRALGFRIIERRSGGKAVNYAR